MLNCNKVNSPVADSCSRYYGKRCGTGQQFVISV